MLNVSRYLLEHNPFYFFFFLFFFTHIVRCPTGCHAQRHTLKA
jgi:hypothetical protein